ncbi:hypothetical protein FOZ63_011014 [Perkinsus olseni]|uniref:Uncharacterized protein n=1 Tax=Perkinsus olseni TaxID=32597 RepID=A0A7J6TLK5_PEROL|nr:hypothetical protein FOZ63_011014 [Perkinsus olseni]
MRSELQSLQKILNEQNKALRWDAVAASQRHALCSDIQEARQKQRELRVVARDLESEIRTKHRLCTDMTLKLRGPKDCRSPPRGGIEKDPRQGVIDEVATLDARVRQLRETRDWVHKQDRRERAEAARRIRELQQAMKRKELEALNREESAELSYEHLFKLQQYLQNAVS